MLHGSDVPEHLAAVDAEAWPGIASLPSGHVNAAKARLAELRFAAVCDRAGIELDPRQGASITVEHDALFRRIADGGWVGLAEGFMAGEWSAASTQVLVEALVELLRADFRPRTPHISASAAGLGGEIPAELVAHFSGDGMSGFAGHFATGVPTTQRVRVKSQVPGAGRGNVAAAYHIDDTEFSAPLEAGRADLGDVQRRSVDLLLDACAVERGTHVLEYPASGGAVAITAAERGATVDAWVHDEVAGAALRDRLLYAGVQGAVHVEFTGAGHADTRARRGHYDAVVSVERLELLDAVRQADYLAELGRLVDPGGRVALQTVMRTDKFTPTAAAALQSLRAYIWPGLTYSEPTELTRVVDRKTTLRIVARTHAPGHLEATVRLQRELFDSRLRDAAASGFDKVYRRLWQWQFALREALARLGMIELTQVTLVQRDRRGRR